MSCESTILFELLKLERNRLVMDLVVEVLEEDGDLVDRKNSQHFLIVSL